MMKQAYKRVIEVLKRGGTLFWKHENEKSWCLCDPLEPTKFFWVRDNTVNDMFADDLITANGWGSKITPTEKALKSLKQEP